MSEPMSLVAYHAAALRCQILVRQLAYHRTKMRILQEELDDLTEAMFIQGCG